MKILEHMRAYQRLGWNVRKLSQQVELFEEARNMLAGQVLTLEHKVTDLVAMQNQMRTLLNRLEEHEERLAKKGPWNPTGSSTWDVALADKGPLTQHPQFGEKPKDTDDNKETNTPA